MDKSTITRWVEKNGVAKASAISVAGVLAVVTVHLAGATAKLPLPYLFMVDYYSIANIAIRFSIILSVSTLLARYFPIMLSIFLSYIALIFIIFKIGLRRKGRRFLRIRGAGVMKLISQNLVRIGDETGRDYSSICTSMERSRYVKLFLGQFNLLFTIPGRIGLRLELYLPAMQISFAFLFFSAIYLDIKSGGILLILTAIMFAFLPKSFFADYIRNHLIHAANPITILQKNYQAYMSPQKLAIIVLSLAFLSGILHHDSLKAEDRILSFTLKDSTEETGYLILANSNGFIFYSSEIGYSFFSHGTILGKISRVEYSP